MILLTCSPALPAIAISCEFSAVFNFGDSNSDTGGLSATFGPAPPPNGETFFGRPSGRYSDGRLIIDFIVWAQALSSAAGEVPGFGNYITNMSVNNLKIFLLQPAARKAGTGPGWPLAWGDFINTDLLKNPFFTTSNAVIYIQLIT
ncbi:Alpha-L-fucosidase 3 [Platanthera guangdongensis]|uniref:Alpha-L-fucosidase 3 n=1 Tax=Platanthera guangdongensis TaxID=2320717 RepID=A0ABR2LCL1_9ASPA